MSRQVVFNGVVLVRAGGATKVDASAFQNLGLGGIGVVGLVGEADAGEPNVVKAFSSPRAMVAEYKTGPLADAADLAFQPMNDPRVPGGASQVLVAKVNQSTKSGHTFKKSTADELILASKIWGVDANKISVEIGTSGVGKTIEVVYEDTITRLVETSQVLGGSAEFTVLYGGAGSAAVMTVSDTQITTSITGGPGGEDLVIPFTTYSTLKEIINYINSAAGGVYTAIAITNNPYTIKGEDLDRVAGVSILTLAGIFYAKLYRMIEWITLNSSLISATRAPVTSTGATSGASTGTGLAPFELSNGATLDVKVDGAVVATTVTFNATAATLNGSGGTFAAMASEEMDVTIGSGSAQHITFGTEATIEEAVNTMNSQLIGCYAEMVDANNVRIVSDQKGTGARVRTSNVDAGITTKIGIANNGDVSGTGLVAGTTQTITNIAALTHAEAKGGIEQAVSGLTYSPATGSGTPPVLTSNTTGVSSSIETPAGTARTIFGFDLLVHTGTAAGAPGGDGAPDDTVSPVLLTGGTRGVSTNTNWQDGYNLLGKVRANQIVPLASEDLVNLGQGSTATIASILAMTDAHAAYYSSTKGKSERHAYVGVKGNKTSLLATAGALQSFNTTFFGQQIYRSNVQNNLTWFPEWGLAVVAAGGRGGSNRGEPLVYKYLRCYGVRQDSSWNVDDDGADMILGGISIAFAPPNQGVKFDRVITTYTREDNDAYTEESVVQVWKDVAYGVRTQLENTFTGVRGLPATIRSVKDKLSTILENYRQEGAIVDSILADGTTVKAYRELEVSLDMDKCYWSAIISPVEGINFILGSMFLVPATIAA